MKKNKLSYYPFHVPMNTRWIDLDAFGHVNNAIFASYIENARSTLFTKWNLPYLGKGKSLILASLSIDYLKQLKHPNEIIVGQKISRIGNTSFDIEASIYLSSDTNTPICNSNVVIVCFDFETQKPIPVFKEVLEEFNS